MNRPVRFAVVGCGRIAYRHIEAIRDNPEAQLVALCDLDEVRLRERAEGTSAALYRNYHQMLATEEIDVVCIMTPSGMHVEHAADVVRRYGKHIVVEKPFALTLESGEQLIDLARRAGVHLFAVHQNRFNKAIQAIREGMANRLFGKPVLGTVRIRWSRGQKYYDRDPWRGTWGLDGGVLTNQAIHHIDLLQWLMGEVVSVSAIGTTRLVDIEVEDTACAWLRFASGALGMIEATTATRPLDHDLEASLSILGEGGTAIAEGASVNRLTTWSFDDRDPDECSEFPPNVYGFGHNVIINNVVETLRRGAAPLVSGNEAMHSIRLLHALYASMEQGGKEVFLADRPVSSRFGRLSAKEETVAAGYRTSSWPQDGQA